MDHQARREGFEEEIKLANPLLAGLGRLGGHAISGALNLGARAAPAVGGFLTKHAPGAAGAVSQGAQALAGFGRSALAPTVRGAGLRQLAGAGAAGAGALGVSTLGAGALMGRASAPAPR